MQKSSKISVNTLFIIIVIILTGLSLVLVKKYKTSKLTSNETSSVTTTQSSTSQVPIASNKTASNASTHTATGNIDTDVKSIDDYLKLLEDDQTKTDKALSDTPIDNGQ